MEKERLCIKTAKNMKDNLKMGLKMEWEHSIGLTVKSLLAIILMKKSMGKG